MQRGFGPGFLSGGFDRKGQPVPLENLKNPEDAQQEHWKTYDGLPLQQYRPHASLWVHQPTQLCQRCAAGCVEHWTFLRNYCH